MKGEEVACCGVIALVSCDKAAGSQALGHSRRELGWLGVGQSMALGVCKHSV